MTTREDDELCALMEELLVSKLTTLEDLADYGLTNSEVHKIKQKHFCNHKNNNTIEETEHNNYYNNIIYYNPHDILTNKKYTNLKIESILKAKINNIEGEEETRKRRKSSPNHENENKETIMTTPLTEPKLVEWNPNKDENNNNTNEACEVESASPTKRVSLDEDKKVERVLFQNCYKNNCFNKNEKPMNSALKFNGLDTSITDELARIILSQS